MKKYFRLSRGGPVARRTEYLKAVDGVSLEIAPGSTYSLVGESGAGKTTVARLVLGIDRCDAGEILFGGLNVFSGDRTRLKEYRSSLSAVYQDPWSSLNPRMRVRDIIAEPLVTHQELSKGSLEDRIREVMESVGLDSSHADHYPHEFSGGQRQRIAIARAVSTSPKLIVLDEPVSSLDVSIRAQIMNLLKRLQKELHITYLLIAHDLATVRFMSHRIGAMYLGKIVEEADVRDFFSAPLHPYTRALISASVPEQPGMRVEREEIVLTGDIPSPLKPPPGCSFHPRCPYRFEPCSAVEPELRPVQEDHSVSCHLYPDLGRSTQIGPLPPTSRGSGKLRSSVGSSENTS